MKQKKLKQTIFSNKDVNLTSREWCDIVFEGKNKRYGAYDLRRTSSKRHLLAFFVVFLFFALIIFVPILVNKITSDMMSDRMLEVTTLSNLKFEEDPDKDIIPPEETPPPMTPTIQQKAPKDNPAKIIRFTTPIIVPAKDFNEETAMLPMEEYKAIPDITKKDTIDYLDDAMSEKYTVEDIYTEVDRMPGFPGGEKGLAEFISSNIRYPANAYNNGIQGSLLCTFIIEKDGYVSHAEIKQGADRSLNEETLRVIKFLPKWKPGERHGKPVRVKYTLPIIFNLK